MDCCGLFCVGTQEIERKILCQWGNTIIIGKRELSLYLSFGKGEDSMKKTETFLMKPKVDFCFKELMEDAQIRQGFLSALLDVKPEKITQTELLPTHLRRENQEDKLGILDVHVLINGKEQMDLEIQILPFPLWPERSAFYLSKMYVGQIKKGQNYDEMQKCIHVGILDFVLFEEDEEFYSRFHLWEDTRQRLYTDKLEIHILELPKLKEREYPGTAMGNWAYFFNAERKEEFEMAAKTDPYIDRAYERLMYLSADEEKRLEYEAREKAILDYNYLMKSNLERGKQQGIEQGMQQGREAGEQRVNQLIERLLGDGRVEDIGRMVQDKEFQNRLFEEFGL